MQIAIELTYWSGIIAAIIALIGGIYLLNLWKNQSVRLWTDLPLAFGFMFVTTCVNMLMLSFMSMGIIPDTLEVFRVRTFVIGFGLFPLLTILMHIWLSQYHRYFKYILSVTIAYWTVVTLAASSSSMIMILVMPIMIALMAGIIITFAVTYKTGRLKEVRSGFIVIAMSLAFVSQLSKVSLMAMGLSFIADIITITTVLLLVLGVANPWKKIVKTEDPLVQEVYS